MSEPPAVTSTTANAAPRGGGVNALIDLVPEGWTLVRYRGRRYGLVRETHANGRSLSIVARELGGSDLVSANVYQTTSGGQLCPCEMPERKVLDFLREWSRADGTMTQSPRSTPSRRRAVDT